VTKEDSTGWVARLRRRGLGLGGAAGSTPADAVGRLTAMQAQEHWYARWSVAQRTAGVPPVSVVDKAFDEGAFLRTHVLRSTWHYVAATDLRWLMRFSGPRVQAGLVGRHARLGLDPVTRRRASEVIVAAVAGHPRTRPELAGFLTNQSIDIEGQRLPHLLMDAELESLICSGPMNGTAHTYAAFDERVPAGDSFEGEGALAELAWRYFSTRGPAMAGDFAWWAGLRAAEARTGLALAAPRLDRRVVDGREYWFVESVVTDMHGRVDLVQCYDEIAISYRPTRDVLATPEVTFPVPGQVDGWRHVVLLDGRLLGHWRVVNPRGRAVVEVRAARALSAAEQRAVDAAVAELAGNLTVG